MEDMKNEEAIYQSTLYGPIFLPIENAMPEKTQVLYFLSSVEASYPHGYRVSKPFEFDPPGDPLIGESQIDLPLQEMIGRNQRTVFFRFDSIFHMLFPTKRTRPAKYWFDLHSFYTNGDSISEKGRIRSALGFDHKLDLWIPSFPNIEESIPAGEERQMKGLKSRFADTRLISPVGVMAMIMDILMSTRFKKPTFKDANMTIYHKQGSPEQPHD